MSDVTRILSMIESGDQQASEDLLPIVYDELRKLAKARMANERGDHTLQSTALVHEAYVRLVDTEKVQHWDSRGHFFSAAAEAMRRILVEHARGKDRVKRGEGQPVVDIADLDPAASNRDETLLQVHDALDKLAEQDAQAAEWIKLRFFGGFSAEEAAKVMGVAPSNAFLHWGYAKASLRRLLS
jgi:RNA polymerase sigma factor (TIGR02999 family)